MIKIILSASICLASCAAPNDSHGEKLRTVVLIDSGGGDSVLIRSRPQNFSKIENNEISIIPGVGPVLVSLNSQDGKSRDIITGIHTFPLHDFKIRLAGKKLIDLGTDFINMNVAIQDDDLKIISFHLDVESDFTCTLEDLKKRAREARSSESDSGTNLYIRNYQKSLVFYVVHFGRPRASESEWFMAESDASISPSLLALSEKLHKLSQDGDVKESKN